MQLSAEQYACGLITWEATEPITVCTATARTTGEPKEWSSPLTDPAGSLVTSEPLEQIALRVGADTEDALSQPYRVRWERLVGDRLVTRVFDPSLLEYPVTLVYVPNFGIFHRLVVTASQLHWTRDSVMRAGDVVIRFIDGMVYGERAAPMDQVLIQDGQVSLTGGFSGEAEAHGRFIEIVAPGVDADRAEQQAYAFLGCLALCLGEGVVGTVVFSEPHEVTATGQTGQFRIPVMAVLPVTVGAEHFADVARVLPTLLKEDKTSRAYRLALRWYERGLRATNAEDRLLAHFIGIEAVLKSYAKWCIRESLVG